MKGLVGGPLLVGGLGPGPPGPPLNPALNGDNFATDLPIDVMFGSRAGFSASADLSVPLSMTLSDLNLSYKVVL